MAEVKSLTLLSYTQKTKLINHDSMKLYNKYEIDMSIRELAEGTIIGYKGDLFEWFIYIMEYQANKNVIDINEDDITEFFYYCKNKGNSSRRMKRRIASLSAFYKFLRRKRIIKENPLEFIDRPKKDTDVVVQTFLTEKQLNLLKEKLKEKGDLQLEVYVLLSISTMARVNAISNIKWNQIDFETRTINDVLEKEGKIVTLYFSEEVKELLIRLRECREIAMVSDSGWLFITKYKKQTNKAKKGTLQGWTKLIGKMINVPTLHPHDFRHSGSQLLKLKGCPIETISELLNHSGIDVTRKHYLRQDKARMQQEKDKYEL